MNAPALNRYAGILPRDVPLSILAVFIFAQILAVFVAAAFDVSLFLPVLVAGIVFLVWSVQKPHVWIFFVIVAHVVMLERSEGITLEEVIFGMYFFGVVAWWFVASLLRGEKIVSSFADKCILVFFGLCLLSVLPALANQADPVKWFRELLIFIPYLLYFPLRKWLLADRKVLISAGLGFLAFSLIIAVNNLLKYKTAAGAAIYTWQLVSGRQTANEPLFLTGVVVGLALFLYAKEWRARVLLLSLVAFFAVTLMLTFSRGYWVGLLIGMFVLAFIFKGKDRFRLVVVVPLLSLAAIGFFSTVFGFLGSSILQSIPERLVSTGYVTRDVSFLSRLSEAEVVVNTIISNPIVGQGLGTFFRFHDPIQKSMYETWYVHNGYLFLWMKTGLMGLAAFLLAYLAIIKTGWRIYKSDPTTFDAHLAAGIASVLVAMLVVSLTSPQFITRDSILIITMGWAAIGSAEIRSQQKPMSGNSE